MRYSIPLLSALLVGTVAAAHAVDQQDIRGRTGLVSVRSGERKVSATKATVVMKAGRSSVNTVQTLRLEMPKSEQTSATIELAVREDYYRARVSGDKPVSTREARGFTSFSASVDGRSASTQREGWRMNKKNDTATRWRVLKISFRPGQSHTVRIETAAPLGHQGSRRYIQFVTKDMSGFKDVPGVLEIKLAAPGTLEGKVDGVEPETTDISKNAIRWVYRKAMPDRDVYVLFPPS